MIRHGAKIIMRGTAGDLGIVNIMSSACPADFTPPTKFVFQSKTNSSGQVYQQTSGFAELGGAFIKLVEAVNGRDAKS